MDKEIFKQLGFLEAEVDVYTALLKLGPSLVSKIHKETGLHRTHIYDLLEKLREKGLVSTFFSAGKKHFQAASPNNLLEYVEEKKSLIKELIPDLEGLSNLPKEETSVELFKGTEGVKSVYNDIIQTNKTFYCIARANKKRNERLYMNMVQFLKNVEKNKLTEYVVFDQPGYVVKTNQGKYKCLDSKKPIPTTIYIYGNKVALFILQPPYHVVLISNNDVYDTYKQHFDFLWELAKEVPENYLVKIKEVGNTQ